MFKTLLFVLLPFLALFNNGADNSINSITGNVRSENTGTLEKMITSSGSVTLDVNLNQLNGEKGLNLSKLRFNAVNDSFFTVLVFNNELRGPIPSSMEIVPQDSAVRLPAKLNDSFRQLVIEKTAWGGEYELALIDAKTGFVFFNIEGHEYNYEADKRSLDISNGRLLLSDEFASELKRPTDAGTVVGQVSMSVNLRPIEVTQIVDGETASDVLPANKDSKVGSVPGPDVVVGNLSGLAQFGSASGSFVGLAIATDSCNYGAVDLNWSAFPSNDHPVIPQNLYRMSGGTDNAQRFEQIGQSSVKHGFTALTNNLCDLGCNGVGGSRLGSGCSDPYSASLNAGPSLGSRAWINPFSGAFPRSDSATPPNNHTGHTHAGPSHRILTQISDLNTSLNAGATYFAEAQYITPHEYAWCVANPTQCNMYNNVSYRRYTVSGTASPFTFAAATTTEKAKSALTAWTGATIVEIRPDPGNDGIGAIGYKVTNTSPGVWHYEYAIYNQNLDRGIQSFKIPIGNGVTISNVGFHAPPQHPGWTGDGTVGNTGFSSTPWTPVQTATELTWSTQTYAANPNANAIRWGTLYNFRFDSNRPPTGATANASIEFFKPTAFTGSFAPINIPVQAPSPLVPTAAMVTVSGKVLSASGRGISNARVTITDSNGQTRFATTNQFGNYRFSEVASGEIYVFSVKSKRYTFAAKTIEIDDNLAGFDFVAEP